MAQEDREDTQNLLDKAEFSAVQTLQNQLAAPDAKIANKAANDLIGIRLKQAPGAGGPVLNLHFGGMASAMRKVKEEEKEEVELIEGEG